VCSNEDFLKGLQIADSKCMPRKRKATNNNQLINESKRHKENEEIEEIKKTLRTLVEKIDDLQKPTVPTPINNNNPEITNALLTFMTLLSKK